MGVRVPLWAPLPVVTPVRSAASHGRTVHGNAERTLVLAEYLPTLLFLIVATGIGVALIVIGNEDNG